MNRLGRKNTVLISFVVTLCALLIPLISYQFPVVLIAFALLGIGNTIMQVSLNPLLTNIVSGEKITSSLTLGQFVKAIASFLGPIVAGAASSYLGNWKMIFPIFAAITVVSSVWLLFTPVPKEQVITTSSGFKKSLGLLKDSTILMFFLGIVVIVGIDVGLNTTLPKFLMERTSMPLENAGLANSLYFAARTIGTFLGAILLMKINGRKFYLISMILGSIAMVVLIFSSTLWVLLVMIFVFGFTIANVFPIIFGAALRKEPQSANEVSGLLIMGIAGGAIIPPVLGVVSDSAGQTGAMVVLLLCFGYLLFNAFRMKED
jgi:fucose permease